MSITLDGTIPSDESPGAGAGGGFFLDLITIFGGLLIVA